MGKKYSTANELLEEIEKVIGRKFSELDVNHRLNEKQNKGVLGQIVEEGVFHYPINSKPEADFANLGIELKVCGVIKRKKDISAKERLALNTFNYENVAKQSFENSDVWKKCEHMLIVLYEYLEKQLYGEMKIHKGFLHEFSKNDIAIIKNDYKILQKKILSGKADTISESDTNYLAACTAGAGHGKTKTISLCANPVKERKFSLKQSYMTQIIRNHFSMSELESVVDLKELEKKTLEEIICDRFVPYIGKSEDELRSMFNITTKSKSDFERFASKMLGATGKANKLDEIQKANIEIKTIRVEENGNIEQNMSFPYFSFEDIVLQSWDESDFRDKLINKKFLFVIYKRKNGKFYFKGTKFWHIPESILDTYGLSVFSDLKNVLKTGNIVKGFKKDRNGKVIRLNNFPKSKVNPFIHIRPHGQNASDTLSLPVADKKTGLTEYTKQCFWLKKAYILSIINAKEKEYIEKANKIR